MKYSIIDIVMGNKQSKPLAAPLVSNTTPSTPAPVMRENDYSLLPVCYGKKFDDSLGVDVNAVKKFEHALYIGAEASRLLYCDVGILKLSLTKAFGLSPDILNKVISHYDGKYKFKKTNLLNRASGSKQLAPDSYELEPCTSFENDGKKPLMRYISSPTDTTCGVISPDALQSNSNSIFTSSDCIVTFKGSSSLRNWEKNLRSVFPGDFAKEVSSLGLNAPSGIAIARAFITPIVEIFDEILKAINLVCPNATRIFVFGHSKGGAEAELGGMMLSLCMGNKLPSVTQVHVISYGSPKVVSPTSKDAINNAFFVANKGNFTLTRVESVGSIVGDTVTDMPPVMVHPGWGNTSNTLDEIRTKYGGVSVTDNKRNPATWPFNESVDLWDITQKFKLDAAVATVIGEDVSKDAPAHGGERSTYLRVRGSRWAPNPHMEYLGMFFLGSQRIPGMANPAKTQGNRQEIPGSNVNKIFIANMFPECTKYMYVSWKSLGSSLDIVTDVDETGKALSSFASSKLLGMGKTRRSKKSLRRTMKK